MYLLIGGLILTGFGFVVSGPPVHGFWMWLALPSIMVTGGVIRLLRA